MSARTWRSVGHASNTGAMIEPLVSRPMYMRFATQHACPEHHGQQSSDTVSPRSSFHACNDRAISQHPLVACCESPSGVVLRLRRTRARAGHGLWARVGRLCSVQLLLAPAFSAVFWYARPVYSVQLLPRPRPLHPARCCGHERAVPFLVAHVAGHRRRLWGVASQSDRLAQGAEDSATAILARAGSGQGPVEGGGLVIARWQPRRLPRRGRTRRW